MRRTNSVEDGIHTTIIRKFGFFDASPDLAEYALADYRLHHNANVRLNMQLNTLCINRIIFIGWKLEVKTDMENYTKTTTILG